MKVGFGYDSHKFVEGRKLFLGCVEIPHDKGLLGHSDADVVIHAISDALLGATGQGDIGSHFPDTDQSFKDMTGMKLLQTVNSMIMMKMFEVEHIDATIVIEKPRIKDYTNQMVAKISEILRISNDRVNIKVKSNEGMRWIGHGEGVASCAVVTVKKKVL